MNDRRTNEGVPRPGDDVDLDGLRYVSGEMTAAEASRFEAQLDRDQRARDAVERAVWLAEALAVPSTELARRPTRPRRWRVAVAALVLAGGAVALWDAPRSSGSVDAEELVGLWVALHDEDPSLESAADALDGDETDDEDDSTADLFAPEDDDLPDWLLRALDQNR